MSTERRQENKFIVYTDIVGHTKMLGRLGMAFKPMRERHDELFRLAVRQYADLSVVKGSGDGFYAALEDVDAAVEVALAFRRALAHEDWNRFLPENKKTPDNHIRSRVGIHSGAVRVQYEGGIAVDFDGVPRNVTEKVMSKAQGNQVLVTRQIRDQGSLNFRRNAEVEWKKYGEFKLREVADTVEIWGLGEAEFPAGAAPAQDPEHRVIIFAVVHDHSTIIEQAGPQFEGLKDRWDATFQKAVDAHSRDTFVKRLPEGSLAAFKNAMEAARAARDFRRMWKAEMRTSIHRLEPKIALDSGLVTFSYENNRPTDVRDQPVNMAAKVAKTGLTAPWQLILTRPVREDAFANMPEREEFGWVCIGRKAVPGEPEPVEIWDFQDVQVKREDRTVLWIDLGHIREDLKSRRDVYIKFVTRLDAMLGEALQRRAEEAWTLQPDAARIAAFRDPVEAVQAAMDLRRHALDENWSNLFQNRGKGWHPLKIVLHSGAVRMTSEDGQRKDIKGAPIDGLKCLADACEMGQVLVSRELKEAVARHLPEGEVHWSRVDVPAKDEVAIEGYALEAKDAKRWGGLAPWQRFAAVGVAAAVVLGVGALVLRPLLGGGPSAVDAAATVPFTKVLEDLQNDLKNISSPDAGFEGLKKAIDDVGTKIALEERPNVSGATQESINAAVSFLKELSRADRANDLDEIVRTHQPALAGMATGKALREWVNESKSKSRMLLNIDPRIGLATSYSSIRADLAEAGLGQSDLAKELDEKVQLPEEIAKLPWLAGYEDKISAAAKERDAYLRGSAALAKRIQDRIAAQSGVEDPLPATVRTALVNARNDSDFELQPMLRAAITAARSRAAQMKQSKMTDEQIDGELQPVAKAITDLVRDQAAFDLKLLMTEKFASPDKLSLEQMARILKDDAADYRYLDEKRGNVVGRAWPLRLKDEVERLPADMRDKPPEVVQTRDAVQAAIAKFPGYDELPWIARNRERVQSERARIEGLFTSLAGAVDAELKKVVAVTPQPAPKLGPVPDQLTSAVAALSGDPDAAVAMIGKTAEPIIKASWEESRRLTYSQADATARLQPVLTQLQNLVKKKAVLDGKAIAADRELIGEPDQPTPGALEVWLLRVGGYVRIEGTDPRIAAEERLRELQKKYVGIGEGQVPETELPREFAETRAELLRQIAIADYPWIEKHRGLVAGPAERVAKGLVKDGPIEKALAAAAEGRKGAAMIDRLRTELDTALDNPPVMPSEEPEVYRAWEGVRREALAKKNSSDRGDLESAIAEIGGWRTFLAALPKDLPPPDVDADRSWARSVADAMKAQREAAIQGAITNRGKPGDAEARKAYKDSLSRVNGFIKRWKALEDAFRNGLQLSDPAPGFEGKKIAEIAAEALADPLLASDAGVQGALRVPMHKARVMQEVARKGEAAGARIGDVMTAFNDPEVGVETRVAVWNAMGDDDFAADPQWLEYHRRVFQRVEGDIGSLPDKNRAEQLRGALAADKPKRWFMYASRAGSYDAMDRAMSDRAAFGIDQKALDNADPALRWNLHVWRIDRAGRAGASAEADARAAIAALLADAEAIAAGKKDPAAAAFLESLRGAAAGSAAAAPGGVSAAQMGPGSEGWDLIEGEVGGERLVYRMKDGDWIAPGGKAPELVFNKVRAGDNDTYVGATEVSVRTVFETLRRRGVDGIVTALYGGTQKEGPFVWDHDPTKAQPLMIGYKGDNFGGQGRGSWIKLTGARGEGEVFPNMDVGVPTADMPMQYISLPAAVFISRQLGCRLPTTAEWTTAVTVDGANPANANLRDLTCKQAFDAAKQCRDRVPGVSNLELDQHWVGRADKTKSHPHADGVVFFQPVDQDSGGGKFKHLIGNVAEIVCDNLKGAESLGKGMPEAQAFVTAQAQSQAFAMVGDSAIGEARANPAEPRRLAVIATNKPMVARGWSDVGMRLAFSPGAFKPEVAQAEADLITKVRRVFADAKPYVKVAASGG